MKTWTDKIAYDFSETILNDFFTEDILFFDIETTGFSAAHSQLYLIGCAYRRQNTLFLTQFFADEPTDESLILDAFGKLAIQFQSVVTFNGNGFDIPYMKTRCAVLNVPWFLDSVSAIDLFKIVSSMKFLLKLPNYKQKTVEQFLGIGREDLHHGGELIEVYKHYQKHPDDGALLLLKTHNYEDVLGMVGLLRTLSYRSLLEGKFSVTDIESRIYQDMDGMDQKELILTCEHASALPHPVSCKCEEFYLHCEKNCSRLSIHLFDGTLKFFFPNPKDYYYLPSEDIAIHKSVASYVDKEFRKQATKNTCYTKKDAIFVPQYTTVCEPVYCKSLKDKCTYFELTEDFLSSPELLHSYVLHVMKLLSQ